MYMCQRVCGIYVQCCELRDQWVNYLLSRSFVWNVYGARDGGAWMDEINGNKLGIISIYLRVCYVYIFHFSWSFFNTFTIHTYIATWTHWLLGRCGYDFESVNFKYDLGIDILSIQINITLEWMPEDHIDGQPTLVQVMAWCRQATSHYLNQYWWRSYGITRSQ